MLPSDSKFREWESIDRLVKKIANNVMRRVVDAGLSNRIDLDDLIQEGAVVYVNSMEKFNPELGFAFTTYMYRSLYTGLNRYVERNGYAKKSGVYMHLSIDAPIHQDGEADVPSMHESMPDESMPSAVNLLEVSDILDVKVKRLSPAAKQVLDWFINPPEWLVEELVASRALRSKKQEQGMNIFAEEYGLILVMERAMSNVWGISKASRAEIIREVRAVV